MRSRATPFPWSSFAGFLLCVGIALLWMISTGIKCCGGLNVEYSSGSRSGVVQKISHKGMYWKTWEAELNLQYLQGDGNGGMRPAIFHFSVADPEVVKQVQAAELSGERVTIGYSQYVLLGFDKGKTSYLATNVQGKNSRQDPEHAEISE